MKKRIIASTMASVMALGAASSMMVASADVADFKTQTATKADLEKLMADKEIKNLIDGGIDNYGSVSGENFQKAVDFANAVLEDAEASSDDYTVAYLMVKAAKGALKQYTKEELQLLVSQCKSTYNTNNELNEDDAIYTEESWDNFVTAYETADDCKESDDILETTDAYEELDKYKNPEELDKVTKSQIERARKNYIAALDREFEFQPWERATITGTKTDYDNCTFSWGALYAHISSGRDAVMESYEDFTEIKGRTVTTNTTIVAAVEAMEKAATVLNAFNSKLDSASSKKSVTDLLSKYHAQLVYTYNADEAMAIAQSFIDAAKAGQDKNKVAGVAKFTNSDGKNEALTGPLTAGDQDTFWNAEWSVSKEYKPLGSNGKVAGDSPAAGIDAAVSGKEYTFKGQKLIGAEMEALSTAEIYYVVDTSRKLENNKNPIVDIDGNGLYFTATKADATAIASSTREVKTINANSKYILSDIIEVSPEDVINALVSSSGASSTETGAAFTAALSDVTAALGSTTFTTAATALATAGTAADTAAAALVTTASTDGAVTADQKSAIEAAAGNLKSAIDDFNTAATGTVSNKADMDALVSAYEAIAPLVGALASALPDKDNNNKDFVKTVYTTDITTKQTALATEFAKVKTAIDAYTAVYNADLAAQLVDVTMAHMNEVYDDVHEADFKTSSNKTNKGIVFIPSGSGMSEFDTTTDYDSSRTGGVDKTVVSLGEAMILYSSFVLSTTDQTGAAALDNNNTLSTMEVGKNYPKAWRLLYNYMKYALADEFDAAASKTYKRSDIVKLKSDAEDLIEKCIETELFNDSLNNTSLNVNAASDWLKLAASDKSRYKDNDSAYDVTTYDKTSNESAPVTKHTSDLNSTTMYEDLKATYDQLKKEYDAFKYSYDDIVKRMASIAKELDSNKFDSATTKKLADELNNAALKFVKVEEVKFDGDGELQDSELFNDDGTMNKNNRLFTNGSKFDGLYYGGKKVIAESKKSDKKNYSHYDMQTAYETLVKDYDAAVKALEEGSKLVYDLNGDGKIDVADVNALIAVYFNPTADDIAKYDYNGDKKIDVADVQALIAEYFKS